MGCDGEAYMDYPSITSSLDVGLDMLGGQGWTLITTSLSGRRWDGAVAYSEACLCTRAQRGYPLTGVPWHDLASSASPAL